jgi:hypothetical protein
MPFWTASYCQFRNDSPNNRLKTFIDVHKRDFSARFRNRTIAFGPLPGFRSVTADGSIHHIAERTKSWWLSKLCPSDNFNADSKATEGNVLHSSKHHSRISRETSSIIRDAASIILDNLHRGILDSVTKSPHFFYKWLQQDPQTVSQSFQKWLYLSPLADRELCRHKRVETVTASHTGSYRRTLELIRIESALSRAKITVEQENWHQGQRRPFRGSVWNHGNSYFDFWVMQMRFERLAIVSDVNWVNCCDSSDEEWRKMSYIVAFEDEWKECSKE